MSVSSSNPPLTRRQAETRQTGKLMRGLLGEFRARMDEELKAQGITIAQVRLLFEVRERAGGSGAQVARACGVTPQSAQAMLARAVERGWIVRGKDPENERLVTARLTPAGAKLLDQADLISRGIEARMWEGVSLAEVRTMRGMLDRLMANVAG